MRSLPRLTDRLSLGDGLLVSPFCLGMVGSPRVVRDAFDAGINFFFLTADMHWPLYEPLRRGLADLLRSGVKRDELVVCSTAYVTQPDFCEMPHEELRDAVPGLERVDIVAMGGVYARDFAARLPVYQAHRARAHVGCKAIGASFHDRPVARRALEQQLFDVLFIRLNPAHPGAAKDVLPFVPKRSRARVFNFKSMDAFRGEGVATDHYRFALSQPGMDGVLGSLDSKEQLRALEKALRAGPLSAAEQRRLVAAAAI
jgi:aryl-alcohol dehydrogenase-like predicted oxidoreductase